MRIASRAAAALILCATPCAGGAAPSAPLHRDQWITYEGIDGDWYVVTGPEGAIQNNRDKRAVFAIRARRGPSGSWGGELRFPANFHWEELQAARAYIPSAPANAGPLLLAETRYDLLMRALRHHRPAAGFRVDHRGKWRPGARVRRYDHCAERRANSIINELVALSDVPLRRGFWTRRRQRVPMEVAPGGDLPAHLLATMSLDLPEVGSGYWRVSPGRNDDGTAGGEPSQLSWRFALVRDFGRSVGLQFDLRKGADTPAARLCRTLSIQALTGATEDRCSIGGVLDRRDGWPIAFSATRWLRGPNGTWETRSRNFLRLAPLEGFVDPPNPCSSA